MRPNFFCCAITLLFLISLEMTLIGSSSAQTDFTRDAEPIEFEPIVVTASPISSPVDESSASISVITHEEIEARQLTSVTDVLRQIEGLHIDQAGGRGSVSSVYLRGADPNHTVVLIDGVRVNNPMNSRGGSFDFSTLSVDNIERIEIVRGPLSSVYGSEAIAGAIHIITKRHDEPTVSVLDLSGGSFGAGRALVETRGMLNHIQYSLSGSYLDHGDPVEGDEFTGTAFAASFGTPISSAAEFQSSIKYSTSDQKTFPDDSGGPDYAVIRETEHRESEDLLIGTSFSRTIRSAWTPKLRIHYYYREEEMDSPGVAPGIRDPFGIPPHVIDQSFKRFGFIQNTLLDLTHWLKLSLGVEGSLEDGTSRGRLLPGGMMIPTTFDMDRKTFSLFLDSKHSVEDRLLVEAGARFDWPEEFSVRTSPRFGIRYRFPTLGTSIHTSWGKGFKLPSFFALGHPIVGNPGLDPETSHSLELGIRQTLVNQLATFYVTSFVNSVEDAIDFQESPVPMLVNRQETSSRGLEFGLSANPSSKLSLNSHLTYLTTDIKGTDEDLRNRPEWRGGLILQWRPLSNVGIHTDILYVGEVLDSSIPTGDRELDDYNRINVAITWNPSIHWKYYIAIQNLLDANYEEAVGFPSPAFGIRLGIRVSL